MDNIKTYRNKKTTLVIITSIVFLSIALDQISKIQNNEYNNVTTNFSWRNEEDLDPRNWKL